MTINLNDSKNFIEVIENAKTQLIPVYSKWIESLYKQKDYWHPKNNPNGYRIPWSKESEAYKEMKKVFDSSGIYLLGTDENIIRYIGMTDKQSRSLHKRLRKYVGKGKYSQCRLAESIETSLDKKECKKSPNTVFERYRKKYPKISNPRLRGALDFAYHGVDGIWFTVLAVPEKDLIAPLEAILIPIANKYNLEQGYPEILNLKGTSGL